MRPRQRPNSDGNRVLLLTNQCEKWLTLIVKCDFYNNHKLKKRVNKDERLFLEYNKERLKKIWEKKDEELENIDSDDMSEESEISTEVF